MTPHDALALADYRRRVAAMYAAVRTDRSGRRAWDEWVRERDLLFGGHAQSPIPAAARDTFAGLSYFEYDSAYRFEARIEPTADEDVTLDHSGSGSTPFQPIGTIALSSLGSNESLTVYWLNAYGGGLFLPFRDGTSAQETYGGGRYLLDTVKGADLGSSQSDRLIVDFNYAYHPSCVHNARWSCPLAPPNNRLSASIVAGERL